MIVQYCLYKHNIPVKRFFFFLFTILFIAAACNKNSSDINTNPHAFVSVYAVVPKAPALNVFLNGNTAGVGVPFGSYTLYNNVDTGTVTMMAQSSSRDINIDSSFRVSQNKYYSLFLTGTSESITPVLLRDSFPKPDSGYCGFRFLVLSPGVPAVDLRYVKDTTISSKDTTIKGTAWVNRNYSDDITNDSINTFKKFSARTYSFYAVNSSNVKDTLARLTNKTFSDSTNYTIMLEGLYNKSTKDTALVIGIRIH